MQVTFNTSPTLYNDLLTAYFTSGNVDVYLSNTSSGGEKVASVAATIRNGTVSFANAIITPRKDIAFRYIIIRNGANDIGYLDYGRTEKVTADDTLTVNFDQEKGVLEIG